MDRIPPGDAPEPPVGLGPEEFYFEGPNLVFTEAHHLKRGFCCCSGCRHCPYGFNEAPGEPVSLEPGDDEPPME